MKWCKCLPCTKVNEEDITALDFSCSLLMEVPSIVFNFERTLQYLYLDCNKIVELPRTLFQCEELRYLGLCDNEIEIIPPLIEKLTNLESLLLNRNCLVSESIPANIHRCQKLKVLQLSSNSITKVPGSITRLVSLRELYLNNCDIEFLPANFGRLNNLHILELRENLLVSLPKSLKRLSDLRRLDISSNMFKKFPEVIGTMTNLTELWVNDNFIFELPDCIGVLNKLTHFDASCNRLQSVPNTLGLCINMTLLSLSMNDLKELPITIGDLALLHTLKLDHNFLESLPSSMGKLSNLEELDVQFNHLTSFPNSIGMLRKLNSLVAAQNSITYLPSEIGSCTALSILTLHYNMLMYLPQEIGHLQNLTSISLINNRLRYLPITILSLKKLKALWLSHNQSQPLITLQTETIENGQLVLVCVFLPQIEMPPDVIETAPTVVPSGRRIGFKEPNVASELPVTLSRIPTPHPKAFVKYQRSLEATFRRSQEGISQNLTADAVYVKEASIVPMKNSADDNLVITEDALAQTSCNIGDRSVTPHSENPVNEENSIVSYEIVRGNGTDYSNNNEVVETRSEFVGSVSSGRTPSSLDNALENILLSDTTSENVYISSKSSVISDKEFQSNGIRPKQPPPYHIAAAYSKTAHLFTNVDKKIKEEAEPKHFTQDQPSNILNPQPKHAFCIQQYENMHNSANEEIVPYLRNDILINEKILKITTSLLVLDSQQYKHLIQEFVHLKNMRAETSHCVSNDIFDTKLEILETALYLLNGKDSFNLQQKYLTRVLEHLQDYLVAIENWPNYAFENDIDTEAQEKLHFLHVATILLQADVLNPDHLDIIDQLLHVNKILSSNTSNVKFETKAELLLQAKFHLIRTMIYFLCLGSNNKEYQYILGTFIEVHRTLEHCNKMHLRQNYNDTESVNDLPHDSDYVEMSSHCHLASKHRGNINWLFGVHRNPKIVKVELTPCCYVLGFTFNYSDEGVFIDEVDKNGNAYQKLFHGDKILMLDDRDISKMDSENAVKAVQVWGPETETFLISRN